LIESIQRVAKVLVDPQNIAMVAANIGQLPITPPAGYNYRVAMSVNDEQLKKWLGLPASQAKIESLARTSLNFLAIEHSPDGQQLVIVSSPQEEPKDAKTTLKSAIDLGINTGRTTARFTSITPEAETLVGGQPMLYVTGEAEDPTGTKMHGLIGCISLKSNHRCIIVYGLQSEGDHYNLDETLALLRCIKSFSPRSAGVRSK
jgi:hypothetical protein